MLFGLTNLRLGLYATALAIVLLGAGLAWWRIDALTAERDDAIRRQGALAAERDQLVATNRANIDAWNQERADRARSDAAALRAEQAARTNANRFEQLKREMRRAQPNSPVVNDHRRRVLDQLRR